MNYEISIIVPIYNAENTIERCAETLLKQSHINVEYIFVNDATPDQSIAILEKTINKYPERKPHCRILHHVTNLGSGEARKTGLSASRGIYTIQIDSDDWCESSMIEKLYDKAQCEDACIVYCDYNLEFSKKKVYVKQIRCTESNTFFEKILRDEISPSLCNKLIKKSLYDEIQFVNFSLGEDLCIILQLVRKAKNIVYIPDAFLYYNQMNVNSITTRKENRESLFIKEYCLFVKEKLVEWGCFASQEKNYYTGVLSRILVLIEGGKVLPVIKSIEPKANNISLLWGMRNKSFLKKIVYSLTLLGLGGASDALKKIKKKFYA